MENFLVTQSKCCVNISSSGKHNCAFPNPYIQGFEGFLSSKDTLRKKQKQFKPEDRVLSYSSLTARIGREVEEVALPDTDP